MLGGLRNLRSGTVSVVNMKIRSTVLHTISLSLSVLFCSDHDFIQQQETHLLALCQRTMSLSVGR